jgi:hypothetical protein
MHVTVALQPALQLLFFVSLYFRVEVPISPHLLICCEILNLCNLVIWSCLMFSSG